jgi:predicted alpha/beta-fold hydrolase
MMGSLKDLFDEKTFDDNSFTMFIIATLITFRIISLYQREKIQFYYNKSSSLARDFLKKSKIREMSYTPYFLTLTGNMQSFIYAWCEIYFKFAFPYRFERELFTLSDGGTIAIDWVIDHEGGIPVEGRSTRPILLMFSGLAGGNDNLYFYSMIKDAMNPKEGSGQGYKCAIVNFRGAAGVPMTSPRLYWNNTWEDVQEPVDYISKKYCCDSVTGKKQRNLYAFSVSLGGAMLGNYLCKVGSKSPLDAAVIYVVPYNIRDNASFFRKNFFKFYDFIMGYNFHHILKNKFDDFKKLMKEDQYNLFVERVMANKYSLMDIDINVMIPSFTEFKTIEEYYEQT